MNAIITTHALDFYSADWKPSLLGRAILALAKNDDPYHSIKWQLFRIGTCEGQFRVTPEAYEILSIINDSPGNGHLSDVLEWFEWAAKKSMMPLRILRFTNERFKKHLIEKRGFHLFGKEDVEKLFKV